MTKTAGANSFQSTNLMPETASAEPPPAPPPTRETINPKLAALFDVKPVETESPNGDTPPPPTEDKPPVEPVTEPEKPASTTDALRSKLAPDFPAVTAEPEKPAAETPTVTPEMLAAETDPKRKESLRKMGEQIDHFKRENEELRRKPAEDPDSKTVIEALRKENEELLARVERTNLLDSPKFQAEHIIPRQKAFDSLAALVKEYNSDAGTLQRAMGLQGKSKIEALDAIREELPSPMLQSRFDRLVEDIESRTATINEALRNSKQTVEEMRRQETLSREERLQQESKQWKGLLDAAHRNLLENHKLEPLQKVDRPGYEWWNQQADEILNIAEDILLKATPEKAATAAVLAGSADAFRKMWLAERAAREAGDKELAELRGAEPSLSSERPVPKVEGDPTDSSSIIAGLRSGAYKK